MVTKVAKKKEAQQEKNKNHTRTKMRNLAWIISVNMGYGHQRAAHPLRYTANDETIVANDFEGISKKDQKIWRKSRKFYEFISRSKRIPLIGKYLFEILDSLQKIEDFYPRRDLSAPTIENNIIYRLIKKGWLKDLILKLNQKKLPLITTFFVPAFVADYWKYKGDIYCIVTDTDISRTWVAQNPQKSKIKYLAPTKRVVERLKLYGVSEKNIYLTGFPLPKTNIGGSKMYILKHDLGTRLCNLDPQTRFRSKYEDTITRHLGKNNVCEISDHPLTLTFAVGGAGAQREIGATIVRSLRQKIKDKEIRLNLVAGSRNDVYVYFRDCIIQCGLKKEFGESVEIIYSPHKRRYFSKFDHYLRRTDILWTKPSELSFYAGLGLPIIMAPPIGSQEHFNKEWLESVGAGITQFDPRYVNEWLFDWLDSGWLAKAAMAGFLYAPKMGTYNIEEILLHKKLKLDPITLIY